MRPPYLHYALSGTVALSLGLGFSFWQSADENGRLRTANLSASIAVEAAQDEVKVLRDKLIQEARERRRAEASQMIAESGERAARQKLAAAEEGRAGAEANLNVTLAKLDEAEQARTAAEQQRDLTTAQLSKEQNERRALENARKSAAATAALISAKLSEELRAIKAAEAVLDAAHEDVRTLAALETRDEPKLCRITPEMPLSVSKLSGAFTARPEIAAILPEKSPAPSNSATDGVASQGSVLLSAERTSQPELSVQ